MSKSKILLNAYYSLIMAWTLFGLLHSLLASDYIKVPAKQVMKKGYRFYRISYSLFATGSMIAVMYFHFTCVSLLLWQPFIWEKISAGIMVLTGLMIMLLCTKKYFLDLSGIDALLEKKHEPVLQLDGIHKYVRHPLYFGTLLFVWALFSYYPYTNNLLSCICITVYTLIGTWFEEKKLVVEYGDAYRQYQKKVAALVPGV